MLHALSLRSSREDQIRSKNTFRSVGRIARKVALKESSYRARDEITFKERDNLKDFPAPLGILL